MFTINGWLQGSSTQFLKGSCDDVSRIRRTRLRSKVFSLGKILTKLGMKYQKHFWVQKYYGSKQNSGSNKNVGPYKILGPEKNLGPKLLG